MLDIEFLKNLAVLLAWAYIPSAVVVLAYTLGSYRELVEIDEEGWNEYGEEYNPFVQPRDKVVFYANIFLPGVNLFCAVLILLIESLDFFTNWVMSVIVESEHRRNLRYEKKWRDEV